MAVINSKIHSATDSICIESPAYISVSQDDLYRKLNSCLVELVEFSGPASVIDLGCGTGSLSRILLEQSTFPLSIWAADPDPDMVAACAKGLGDRVGILHAGAEDFDRHFPSASMDAILIGNALHLVDDVAGALRGVARVLKPGGVFAFNTAFHDDALDPRDRSLAWELVLEAHRIARRSLPDFKRPPGVRPPAKRALNVAFYEAQLLAAGLIPEGSPIERSFVLPPALTIKILSTPVFAAGALPGVPTDIAVEALNEAGQIVLERAKAQVGEGVKRTWIYWSARRSKEVLR